MLIKYLCSDSNLLLSHDVVDRQSPAFVEDVCVVDSLKLHTCVLLKYHNECELNAVTSLN